MTLLPKLMAFLLLAIAFPVQAAQVKPMPLATGQIYQFIYVTDVVLPGDDASLERALVQASVPGNRLIIVLDSRGGDVDVSMAMGRSIRRYRASTYHGHCASSCVFAFLGGVNRYTTSDDEHGSLVVHRPEMAEVYLRSPNAFNTQMMNMLRTYIVDMTGGAALYDEMMKIPFSEPRAFTSGEALHFHAATALRQ